MPELTPFGDDLWVAHQHHTMFGLHLGTRMTVVRCDDGLWVHSPIDLTDAVRRQVDDLGPVRHIVAPNAFHHLYAGPWKQAYPEARLWGAKSLVKKRRDLALDGILGEDDPGWGLRAQHVDGCMMDETVFLHEGSGTLIHCDLFENFHACDHWFTRTYLKAGGVWQRPGLHPIIRTTYTRRAAARPGVRAILDWDFDRVVLAHGDCVTEGARAATEQGMAWLMG